MTERQILNTKKKIRSLRARLNAEKRKHGWYDDSAGNRYLIGELYLKIGAYKLAKKYFDWFDQEFPDDIGFPVFNFGRVRTLFECSAWEEGRSKLIDLERGNTYLIDLLLERPIPDTPKWEWSNIATLDYAKHVLMPCKRLTNKDFTQWLTETTSSPTYQSYKQQYIDIQIQLLDTPPSQLRTNLVESVDKLIEQWKGDK